MHSRFVPIAAFAVASILSIFAIPGADAATWFDGQEILIECPVWHWAPSQLPGIGYEICFDDIDHCSAADIGDSVCIPSLGVHDVWITAIDDSGYEPVYYDGDIVEIARVVSADFDADGKVGLLDLTVFIESFGEVSGSRADLDGDGIVGFVDFAHFSGDFGKCVDASGAIYRPCS